MLKNKAPRSRAGVCELLPADAPSGGDDGQSRALVACLVVDRRYDATVMHEPVVIALLIFFSALLYSSVGHGGGSAYLAVMALAGFSPQAMRPVTLLLNVLVAGIGTVRFGRAGCFSWSAFWPFAATSIPMAYFCGRITLEPQVFKPLVGLTLLAAAIRMFAASRSSAFDVQRTPRLTTALPAGAALGALAGLTGTGGGIFLSPLLLFMHWADSRRTAGVSAAFVLCNSLAGIVGLLRTIEPRNPPVAYGAMALWAVAAVCGGVIGSYEGARKFAPVTLRRCLAVVLTVAGIELIRAGVNAW